eukprot:6130309-Pleurochrysis_carterae.AAC.1
MQVAAGGGAAYSTECNAGGAEPRSAGTSLEERVPVSSRVEPVPLDQAFQEAEKQRIMTEAEERAAQEEAERLHNSATSTNLPSADSKSRRTLRVDCRTCNLLRLQRRSRTSARG